MVQVVNCYDIRFYEHHFWCFRCIVVVHEVTVLIDVCNCYNEYSYGRVLL